MKLGMEYSCYKCQTSWDTIGSIKLTWAEANQVMVPLDKAKHFSWRGLSKHSVLD